MTGTLESTRTRSACRSTPTFRRIELSWVLSVVIRTPEAAATSLSFLPVRSAAASLLSAGDDQLRELLSVAHAQGH
jgi:hypothetical protein